MARNTDRITYVFIPDKVLVNSGESMNEVFKEFFTS